MIDFSTRFTALGLSGSGKTCYVMGMYSEMASGIRGWTIRTANADADRIARQLKIMENRTGGDRFPAGTQDYVFDDYEFELYFRNKKIMNFNWADYAGGILEDSGLNYDSLSLLEDCIITSTVLYIFIDGELLCSGDTKQKIKNIKMKCANYINPRISDFMKKHEDLLPPVVFVITKADLCAGKTNLDEIKTVLEECFSSIFLSEDVLSYIVHVSLGEDISENDYSGEVEPINIQTPFFIGIAHDFFNKCVELMDEIINDNDKMCNAIRISRDQIDQDNNDIRNAQRNIDNNNAEIERRTRDNDAKASENEKYLREIEEAEEIASQCRNSIYSEERYIQEKSTNFLGFKSLLKTKLINRSEIENARANIRSYERKKEAANSDIQERENWTSENNDAIDNNNAEIERRNNNTDKLKRNIQSGYIDIEEQNEIIKQCEINIAENTKKREHYKELLSDVNEELKRQQHDDQFIVVRNRKPVEVDFILN